MTNITMAPPVAFDGAQLMGQGGSDSHIKPPTIEELKALKPAVTVVAEDPLEPVLDPTDNRLPSEEAETPPNPEIKEEPVYEPGSVEAFTGGKFKNVEELAKAYNHSAKVYQANQDLEKKLQEFNTTPDSYAIPEKIKLTDVQKFDLIAIATNASLSQGHFNKLCEQYQARLDTRQQQIEQNKQSLGKEKINLLHEHFNKHYPTKTAEILMTQAIENPELAKEALEHRAKTLDNTPPGTGSLAGGGNPPITEDQYQSIAKAYFASPNNRKLETEFIKAAQLRSKKGH